MIGVIDYDIGNLGSIGNALKKLKKDFFISGNPLELQKAKMLILPGVGSANEGMENIKLRKLDKFLFEQIKNSKPTLGFCLGMQLLFEESEEGNVTCLGIIKGKVKKFQKMKKIPQIGWNEVMLTNKENILFEGIPDNSHFYFVNSYYCEPVDKSIITGISNYGEDFPSIINFKNIMATQFHPEKSGEIGFNLIKNFMEKNYAN